MQSLILSQLRVIHKKIFPPKTNISPANYTAQIKSDYVIFATNSSSELDAMLGVKANGREISSSRVQ